MLVLVIDTAFTHCGCAILDNDKIIAQRNNDIGTGHAERLVPDIQDCIQEAGIAMTQIDRIGVNIGPGSFTGIRTGVATARALALALDCKAIGIDALSALAYEMNVPQNFVPQGCAIVMHAGRDTLYVGDFDSPTHMRYAPTMMTIEAFVQSQDAGRLISGNATEGIKAIAGDKFDYSKAQNYPSLQTFGFLTSQSSDLSAPKPLYIRAPDAKPQQGFILPRQ